MLKVIRSIQDLDFRALADVYIQSCQRRGTQDYPYDSPEQQLRLSEQDFFGDVRCFLKDKSAFYAAWEADERYISALRMEPYKDGLLLEGLETLPEERGKGYAKELVRSALSILNSRETSVVYSHIDKNNSPSIAVHRSCGFEKILDYAVYVDGSVSHNAYTMIKRI